jgi:mannonate dehydratase
MLVKLGFGFYRHMLNRAHYDFAVQCGATHAVVHLVDYTHQGQAQTKSSQPVGGVQGWGLAGGTPEFMWSKETLLQLKQDMQEAGLQLEAIENFDPAHWFDVLLDGPHRQGQLAYLQQIIRNVGGAGIPIFGYNFSIAGVCARSTSLDARGRAETVGMNGVDETCTAPMPANMVWNMRLGSPVGSGLVPETTTEALWERLTVFLRALVPVAEEVGVRLAAHPDDPPLACMRQQPRLVYQPRLYQRLLDIMPSPANALEFCLGTLQEMTDGDIYETCTRHSRQGDIAYIHFRNVRGKVPHYTETFIDDGDIDMRRIVGILRENRFDGVLVPDHTPQMSCDAPWHAGMAYAMGYMKALLDELIK